jgi:hypothetical protein
VDYTIGNGTIMETIMAKDRSEFVPPAVDDFDVTGVSGHWHIPKAVTVSMGVLVTCIVSPLVIGFVIGYGVFAPPVNSRTPKQSIPALIDSFWKTMSEKQWPGEEMSVWYHMQVGEMLLFNDYEKEAEVHFAQAKNKCTPVEWKKIGEIIESYREKVKRSRSF